MLDIYCNYENSQMYIQYINKNIYFWKKQYPNLCQNLQQLF